MQHQQTRRWMSAVVYSWAAPTALATIVGAAAAASCCASRACPRGLVLARDSAAPESGKSLKRLLEPGHRLVVLQAGLDLAAQRLVASSGARRKRLELLRRVQAQLEVVDKAAAQWLHSKWTFEQATSVACALSQVQSLGTGGGDNVVSLLGAVTGLLGVMDSIEALHVDQAAQLYEAADRRAALLEGWLESAAQALLKVSRKERKTILQRTESLLDELDEPGPWVGANWTPEQASSVAEAASHLLWSMESTSTSSGDVAAAVLGFLAAVEMVISAHIPRAETMSAALQSTESAVDTVVTILEHGLDVLDALSVRTPRKKRKAVEAVCAQIESVMEGVDEGMALEWKGLERSQLFSLSECLCAVEALEVETPDSIAQCIDTVRALLEALGQCNDMVTTATRLLTSEAASERLQGLTVLRGLERVSLAEAVESEVMAMPVLKEMVAVGKNTSFAEMEAAYMSMFAICFRNSADRSIIYVPRSLPDLASEVAKLKDEGRRREGFAALFACGTCASVYMYHSCYGTEEEKELNEFLPAALREFFRIIRADSSGEFTRQILIFATEVVERHGDDMFAC